MIRRVLVRLYPAAWRARYADEFLAMLGACPLTPRLIASVLHGALDAHLHFTTTTEPPMESQQTHFVLRWVGLTLAGFGMAYAVLMASMALGGGGMAHQVITAYAPLITEHEGLAATLRLASMAAWLALWPLLALILGAVQACGLPAAMSAQRWILATGLGGMAYGGLFVATMRYALPTELTIVVFIAATGLAQGVALARRTDVLPWGMVVTSACVISYAVAPLVGALGVNASAADAASALAALLLGSALSGAALWHMEHARPVQHPLT